ncbi:unnamed protein product, partial [Acanthoscelides obtectus]
IQTYTLQQGGLPEPTQLVARARRRLFRHSYDGGKSGSASPEGGGTADCVKVSPWMKLTEGYRQTAASRLRPPERLAEGGAVAVAACLSRESMCRVCLGMRLPRSNAL